MTFPNFDRISGVHNYCDGWCERCPFTTRCSVHAITVAIGMCGGDSRAGMALAVSLPPPVTAEEERRRAALIDAMNACNPTDAEVGEFAREEEARSERIEETAAVTASMQASLLMDTWFDTHDAPERAASGPAGDALQVARWDRHLIPVKVQRALHGLDEYLRGETTWDDPVQNDWNGTAKLALLCLRRSIEAWDTLAEALGDPDARAVADQLRALRAEMERTFPNAFRFIRPGFDESRGPM